MVAIMRWSYFTCQDPHGLELMVGITHLGVVVFHHKRKVNTFEW